MRRLRSSAGLVAGLLLLLLSAPVIAEVGVFSRDGTGEHIVGPYLIGAIIEDGDPVGLLWRAYSQSVHGRYVLNAGGEANGDGRPSLLFNMGNRLPVVAWAQNSPGGYDVVVSWFVGGAWTDPFVLADDATVAEPADPSLLIDPSDGSVHVLYWTDDAWPRVMHRQAPADLSSWSPPVQVSQGSELAVRPAGVFHEGTLHVVYEVHTSQLGGTPRQIVLAWENGGGFSSEPIATTQYSGPNRPQVHSAGGRIWIDWIDTEGEMAWSRREAPDPWDPVLAEPFTTRERRDYHVRGEIKAQALD